MMETILAALGMVGTWQNMVLMFTGMLGGVIIGALPGLNGTMAVTLVLPFTFTMEPISALLLLIAIYKGALYGGSISAILIRTPGTGSAACTVLDGYPLAQQGKAAKALYMCLYAACFADFLTNMSLIFFTGFIAQMALKFGPPEFFMLIVFSLTIVASLAGENLFKGLIGGAVGLWLTTIGIDAVYGTSRYAGTNADLMSGLSFIPVIIGIFALPECIKQCTGRASSGPKQVYEVGRDRVTMAEWKGSFKSIFRGSIIGIILGAIPGIGGAPAAFLSYSEAKRYSKNPQLFGKGAIEGVAASEAGASGCGASTLIPLLSLGVPGDVVTAVLIGAFLMHDLTPGPLLFQNHLDLIYALYIGIMISSFLLFICGKVCIHSFAKITKIPKSILFPSVLLICVFGAFAINNSMFDVKIMAVMGLVGYIMYLCKIPEAPLLVAFVLGPMFEDNLQRSLLLSQGSYSIFFESIICWVFIALTVFSVAYTIRQSRRNKADRGATSQAV